MKPLTLGICLLAAVAGCKSEAQTNAILARAKALAVSPEYVIGNGDQVTVQILGTEGPTVTEFVRPDGKISFPNYGDIQAEGKTTEALRAELEEAFKAPPLGLKKPKVYVSVHSFTSKQVTVLGQVLRPGRYPYTGPMRVTDLLGLTNGLQDLTSAREALLFREVEGKTKIYEIKISDFLKKGDFTTNFYVRPGDIVYVPRSGLAKVALGIEKLLLPLRAVVNGVGLGNQTVSVFVPGSDVSGVGR